MFPKDSLQPGIRRASRANAFAAGRAHVSKTGNPDSGRHPTETGPIQGLSGQTARPKFRWARVKRARMSWALNARARVRGPTMLGPFACRCGVETDHDPARGDAVPFSKLRIAYSLLSRVQPSRAPET